ncbi:MAG TPA: sigma-70 family RNA polymerase sigma factor [Accumulibacter sp.]|nr:sigma-70 family RNA polymerase sigma factor [Accumulibacter sp.]
MQSVDPVSLLPSVRWLAWQSGAVTETDDLVQVGMLGVLEALRRSEGDVSVSYLVACARGAMLDYLRTLDPLSRSERRLVRVLERARDRVERRAMRPASLAEVAAEAGVSVADAAAACDVWPCALDFALDVRSDQPAPDEALAALHAVREAIVRYQRLDARWRTIIDDWLDERPQTETAAALGVTSGRVTQIRQQALERVVG